MPEHLGGRRARCQLIVGGGGYLRTRAGWVRKLWLAPCKVSFGANVARTNMVITLTLFYGRWSGTAPGVQ